MSKLLSEVLQDLKKEKISILGKSYPLKKPCRYKNKSNPNENNIISELKFDYPDDYNEVSLANFSSIATWKTSEKDKNGKKIKISEQDKLTFDYFDNIDKINELTFNPNVVFLGINAGIGAQGKSYKPFHMFHGTYDKLKNLATPIECSNLEGGYITDLFKLMPTSDASMLNIILNNLSSNDKKNIVNYNIELFNKELSILGPQKKLIILLNGPQDNDLKNSKKLIPSILKEYGFFDNPNYAITNVTHYSSTREINGVSAQDSIKNEITNIINQYDELLR